MSFQKFLRLAHFPALLWMGLLFYASSLPGSQTGWIQPPIDKIIHFGIYSALGIFLCMFVRTARWQKSVWLYSGIVLLAVLLFGVSDEFHQSFSPGRNVSLGDLLADVVGGGLGVLVFVASKAWRFVDMLFRR